MNTNPYKMDDVGCQGCPHLINKATDTNHEALWYNHFCNNSLEPHVKFDTGRTWYSMQNCKYVYGTSLCDRGDGEDQ